MDRYIDALIDRWIERLADWLIDGYVYRKKDIYDWCMDDELMDR